MGGARFRFENGSFNSSEKRVLAPPVSAVVALVADMGHWRPGRGNGDVIGNSSSTA